MLILTPPDPTSPPPTRPLTYRHRPVPPPAVRTLVDVYMIAKIVGTLYLVYPACRGARRLYQGWIDPEERAKRRVSRAESSSIERPWNVLSFSALKQSG